MLCAGMSLRGSEGARRGGGGLPLLAGMAWAVLVSSTLLQVCEATKGTCGGGRCLLPRRVCRVLCFRDVMGVCR